MPALGEEFRAAREARNLSLSDVSEQIHIRSVYLKSLEEEDWGVIAAPVYVRGFIRTYARFLGLDPEGAIEKYNATLAALPPATASATSGYASERAALARRGASLWLWLAGAAALALVAFVAYSFYDLRRTERMGQLGAGAISAPTPIASSSNAPGATAPPSVPSPGATGKSKLPGTPAGTGVSIRLDQSSWLRVDVDGRQQIEGLFPAGTNKTFSGKHVTVRAGNAGGVNVAVNGKDLGKLGNAGDVIEKTYEAAK